MKSLLITILAISLTHHIQAQTSAKETAPANDHATPKELPSAKKAGKMKDLNLTDEQRMKMIEYNNVNRNARLAIEADSSLTSEQKQQQISELKKSQIEKLKAILTPEQFEQLKNMRKEE